MERIDLPYLTTKILGRQALFFSRLDSTNQYGKEHGAQLPDGTVILAKEQFAGRGRQGRAWLIEPGSTLAMSVVVKGFPASYLPLLPMGCGLAVSQAFGAITGTPGPIKWPNDVLLGKKKACGILCESRLGGENPYTICGIGINTGQPAAFFEEAGLPHATSLRAEGFQVAPLEMASAILNALEPILDTLRADGFSSLCKAYSENCVTVGATIRVIQKDGERVGKAVAILPDGNLLADFDGRPEALCAGEVSVRGLYGYV